VLAFILTNGGGVLLAVLCWLLARRSRSGAFIGALVLLAALILKAVLTHKPAWEAGLFPWSGYLYVQGYWLFAVGGAFFALAAPLLPMPRNRRAIAILAATVLAAGAWDSAWMFGLPEVGEDRHADANHQCRQSTLFTCAPTACVCALSYVGIDTTEREMARLCLTRRAGTTRFNTYRGLVLKLSGTRWRPRMVEIAPEELCRKGSIAVIDEPAVFHAIAVIGTGDGVILHDPLDDGPLHWSPQMLKHAYGGLAIVIEPIP